MSITATRRRSPLRPRWRGNAAAYPNASLVGVFAFIVLLHIVGWGTLLGIVVPRHLSAGSTAFGIGIGLTAYTLGVRHAFDADHIAAIDNTTRKLMQVGKRPISVGFWFSFGHSSVVFALALMLVLGIGSAAGPMLDAGSELRGIADLIGTIVSSGFLYTIAALNVVVLVNVWKAFRRPPARQYDDAALEQQLNGGGIMSRLVRRAMKIVTEPWQRYLVGLLFGLGFDTATEIALLVLTASGAASGLPHYAVLCLPILFAAGMSLFDTIDGAFMTVAYGWALARPARRIYYNLVVTGLSVVVALIVGTVEIVGLLAERLHLPGSFWTQIESFDLSEIGLVIVGLFIVTWLAAIAIWKYARLEARCSPATIPTVPDSD